MQAREAFLTAASAFVLPVVEIDGEADRRRAAWAGRARVPPPLHRGSSAKADFLEPCHSFGVDGLSTTGLSSSAGAAMRTLLLHNPTAGDGSLSADIGNCSVTIGMFGHRLLKARRQLQGRIWRALGPRCRRGRRRHGGKGRAAYAGPKRSARAPADRHRNNVAHSLDLLGEAEEIAANLQGAPTRPLDLGSVKGPWGERSFIEAVGLGAFAPAITRSDPKPPFEHRIRLGREALCEAIAAAEPHRIALTVDGEPLDGEFLFVEVLNLRFSDPRLPIAYFAEPGDQMLDIVLLCEDQRQAMLDWVRAAPEETPPPVLVHIGRNVKMAWDGAPLRLDDRVCPPPRTARMSSKSLSSRIAFGSSALERSRCTDGAGVGCPVQWCIQAT